MSMLLSRRLLRKTASLRFSLRLILSNGYSSSSLLTPPCYIMGARPCGDDLGKLVIMNGNEGQLTYLEKKVPLELVCADEMITVGSSHGWVATLKEDGILRLQDDLNPVASDIDPKRIPLPPLVTLPGCQTQIVTNMAISSPSPEKEDCVVAIKFLGPQLSFCRPAQSNSQWTNIKIKNPCFFSSRVMYSKKDDMFRIPGSGGHLIGSWDPRTHENKLKFHRLRFQNLPELTKTKWDLLDSCYTREHLVESRPTGETFFVKWYREACWRGMTKLKTKGIIVFKLDAQGNAVYTTDIGDLCMFLSNSEPFCVPASSISKRWPNFVKVMDVDEAAGVLLDRPFLVSITKSFWTPYFIPPQNI